MSDVFTRIVVDKKEEAKFRRRAMRVYPLETIEALWGHIQSDILYVYAFVKMEIKQQTIHTLHYDDQELDFHADDAREAGLKFLGTIHSHPNCEDAVFSECDLRDSQNSDELVMGICSIQKDENSGRKKCEVAYWPTIRPLIAIRKEAEPRKKFGKNGKKAARRKR